MFSEFSQNVVGMISSQTKEEVGSPARVQESTRLAEANAVEAPAENAVPERGAAISAPPNEQELGEAVESLNEFVQFLQRC